MRHSSIGQDTRFSTEQEGFDSPMPYQLSPRSSIGQDTRLSIGQGGFDSLTRHQLPLQFFCARIFDDKQRVLDGRADLLQHEIGVVVVSEGMVLPVTVLHREAHGRAADLDDISHVEDVLGAQHDVGPVDVAIVVYRSGRVADFLTVAMLNTDCQILRGPRDTFEFSVTAPDIGLDFV